MKLSLEMSDVIKLLKGQTLTKEITVESTITEQVKISVTEQLAISLPREDTSITAKGAVERVEGEWDLVLGKQ